MKHRIEEFTQDGKNFIYLDLSEFKENSEYSEFVAVAKETIAKYAENSLFTITNIRDVKFDTETKRIIAEWMKSNKPYVKYGAVIGFDGIKRIVVNAIFKMGGRKNMMFFSHREQAVEWLLKQG
ncbi:MAG: hypothetical protein LBC64_09085 [Fibromonadaceae bacterium]|jgi:hypothetical protein|nr:hypothetical protein [Fibromonadaceae bacterium]